MKGLGLRPCELEVAPVTLHPVRKRISGEVPDEISRRIIEGYERIPETEEEMAWAEASGREGIREEPWDVVRRLRPRGSQSSGR